MTGTLIILSALLMCTFAAQSYPEIMIQVVSRDTNSLKIRWNISDTNTTGAVTSYRVNVKDLTDDYFVSYEGDKVIDEENMEATFDVHESDRPYNVCVVAMLDEEAKNHYKVDSIQECTETSTIVVMQLSSIIALICVLGFFLTCFIVGYCAWKCAAKKGSDPDYEKSDVNGNGDIVPLTQIEG